MAGRVAPVSDSDGFVEGVLAGDRRVLARAISEVENQTALGRRILSGLYVRRRSSHVIGITGSAGSGKSTLTAELARHLRRLEKSVAVIAIDPSSPFSRGALLGDRIRMQDLAGDPGVFIRSLATRGSLGGLSAATLDVAAILAAAAYETIIIETVGAGQDEVDVAQVADTTVVVTTPGAGDDVQAIKAGIMEIADVLVVNKADLPGAEAVAAQLLSLLSLVSSEGWQVPVVQVSALRHEGLDELMQHLAEHRQYLVDSPAGAFEQAARARHAILASLRAALLARLEEPAVQQALMELAEEVAIGQRDPHSAAGALLKQLN